MHIAPFAGFSDDVVQNGATYAAAPCSRRSTHRLYFAMRVIQLLQSTEANQHIVTVKPSRTSRPRQKDRSHQCECVLGHDAP